MRAVGQIQPAAQPQPHILTKPRPCQNVILEKFVFEHVRKMFEQTQIFELLGLYIFVRTLNYRDFDKSKKR